MRTVLIDRAGNLLETPDRAGAVPGMMLPVEAFVGIDSAGVAVLVLRPLNKPPEFSAALQSFPPGVGL